MLLITVEIHPGGDASRAETLGTMEIANVTGGGSHADYVARFLDDEGDAVVNPIRIKRHERARGFWVLVRKALAQAFPR